MILSTTSLFIGWSWPETAYTKLLQIVLFIVYMNSQVMFTFTTMGQVVVCHRSEGGRQKGPLMQIWSMDLLHLDLETYEKNNQ